MEIRCVCPPKADGTPRHDHDTVELKEKMDFLGVRGMVNALALEAGEDGELDMADILAVLTLRFIRYGIVSWTLVDAHNKPVPVSRKNIDDLILPDYEIASAIGDAVDDRYRDAVMLPLILAGERSSPSTPTNGSTSPRKRRSSSRPAPSSDTSKTPPPRSSPSSISTIPTAGIEVTSSALDGVSSSSPNSESAA